MALLPAGFALPPLPYLLVLVVAVGAVGYALRERPPAPTEAGVVALTPWMLAGAWLHVLYVRGLAPAVVAPLLGTPAVYVSVAVVAAATWVVADAVEDRSTPAVLWTFGSLLAAVPLLYAVADALAAGRFRPFWPGVALLVGVVVGAAWWSLLSRWRPAVAVTGRVGALALVGHAVDGVSTAVGVDLLGYGERTPLSRLVIEAGKDLPTAQYLGAGWTFVLVKLAVAGFVVWMMGGYVEEEPGEGRLLLAIVAAVGLGPGAHNLLLFAVS